MNNDIIFVKHTWHGVSAVDFAAFGWTKGVPATLDCCSLLVLRDEKIVEWSDYA